MSTITAAGPLTLGEAEAVFSSRPPPPSQAAPSPDYTSDLPPAVEVCSCDEALSLRSELALSRAEAEAARREAAAHQQRVLELSEKCLTAANRLIDVGLAQHAAQVELVTLRAQAGVLEAERNAARRLLDTAAERDRDLCAEADSLREQLAELRRQHDTEQRKLAAANEQAPARTDHERAVLVAAERFLDSWENHDAEPDEDDLPAEHALYNAVVAMRAARIDARIDGVENEHEPGCRFEREFPAIDPEDCPRCAPPIDAEFPEADLEPPPTEEERRVLDTHPRLVEAARKLIRAWNEGDDDAINDAFDALGEAVYPYDRKDLGLDPEEAKPHA